MGDVDFVRHIVNPILSRRLKDRERLVNAVDEIRKFIVEAEEKYGFSVYGGDLVKLCDYLSSNDFKILVDVFRSIDSIDILVEILNIAKIKYSRYERIVECVDKALKTLGA